jgi:hypothetical protein
METGKHYLGAVRRLVAGMAVTALVGGMAVTATGPLAGAAAPQKTWARHHRPHFIHPAELSTSPTFLGKGGKIAQAIPYTKAHGTTYTAKTGYVAGGHAKLAATPQAVPIGKVFNVDTFADLPLKTSKSVTCVTATTNCSLLAASEAAYNLGDHTSPTAVTIDLQAGTYAETVKEGPTTGSPYLQNPAGITVNGAATGGTVLQGSGKAPVIGIGETERTGTTAVLNNLTITGGYASYDDFDGCGGGIWMDEDSLDILEGTHLTVTGNKSQEAGAGICASGSVYLSTSTVSDNTVMPLLTKDGTYAFGAGVAFGWDGWSGGRLQNVSITGNTINTSTDVGCNRETVDAPKGASSPNEEYCEDDDYEQWFAGGGGLVTFEGSTLTLIDSRVNSNTVSSGTANCQTTETDEDYCGFLAGGGILNIHGQITAATSSVSTNTIDQTGTCADYCEYGVIGGGVANFGGAAFSHVSVDGNSASTGAAGNTTMNSSEGGGIDTYDPMVLSDSTVDGNSATGAANAEDDCAISGGAGIFAGTVGFDMSGTTVSGNHLSDGAGAGVVVWDPDTYSEDQPNLGDEDTDYVSGDVLSDDVVSNNDSASTYAYKTNMDPFDFGSGGGVYAQDGEISISDTTIEGNHATTWDGGLWVTDDTWANVKDTTIAGNSAYQGGGILLTYDSVLAAVNSTIADNSSTGATHSDTDTGYGPAGGGIYSADYSLVHLVYDTIAGNTSATTGGGLFEGPVQDGCCEEQGNSTAVGTIIAGNTAGGLEQDCSSSTTDEHLNRLTLTDAGWNISGDNSCNLNSPTDQTTVTADLSPLGTSGGPTQTMMPYVDSPAIDAGNGPACPLTDQRGAARPSGACDAGAVQAPTGYYVAGADGGVFAFGGAAFYGSATGDTLNAKVVGIASLPTANGYWLATANGKVVPFGDAVTYGSMAGIALNAPIVGIASTRDGKGYWLVGADGGVYSFGDAAFYGSTGAIKLNKPIVGMAMVPDGTGYWLVASDGGIFAFGSATFWGSTGGTTLNAPIVGMTPTPTGNGYWLAAADGGVFAFGGAAFDGSEVGKTPPLHAPIVGMSGTNAPGGYWLAGADGGVFSFGDAPFDGSLISIGVTASDIVGIATA